MKNTKNNKADTLNNYGKEYILVKINFYKPSNYLINLINLVTLSTLKIFPS